MNLQLRLQNLLAGVVAIYYTHNIHIKLAKTVKQSGQMATLSLHIRIHTSVQEVGG